MPTKPKPRWRRWTRRVLIVLTAGVLLTIASSWFAQWRGFSISRQVRWVQGPHTILVNWMRDPGGYYDSGDGIWRYNENYHYSLQNSNPAPQHTVKLPAEILWLLDMNGWGGQDRWSAQRHHWDHLAPIEGYNGPEEKLFIEPTRGNYFDRTARSAYYHTSQMPQWHAQARALAPAQAIHTKLDPTDPLDGDPFLDQTPGWIAASAFRPVPGHDDTNRDIPVERWSAQRCGWPMHAMMTEQYAIGPRPPIERVQDMPLISLRHGLRGGLILHHQPQHPMLHPLGHHSLPLMPLWPGFAINTAAYAGTIALLWLTIGGSIHLRGAKKRRRKQGLCESCGYDIQDLPTCPECGNSRSTNQRS